MELSTNPTAVRQRRWRAENYTKAREVERRSREKHPAKYYPEKKREYYRLCVVKKRTPEWYRQFYTNNRAKVLTACKAYRDSHLEIRRAKYREYYRKNRLRVLAKNAERDKSNHYKLRTARRKSNPVLLLRARLNSRMRAAIQVRKGKKQNRTEELIGCSVVFFRQFIEHQFTPEMTWENHGSYWHIDHIIPVKQFDLRDVAEQKKAFHYSNCRPLEAKKNIAKSDNLPGPHQPLLL